jgi:valyl-tRNA synthetase
MQAHQAASRMFWPVFCDRYLEMVKDRLAGDEGHSDDKHGDDKHGDDKHGDDKHGGDGARWTLWESFRVLLGLFAPFAPFVTEHLYQRFYAPFERTQHEPGPSLHLTRWPAADPAWRADPAAREAVDQLAVILDATRALRSELRIGNSARLRSLTLQAHTTQAAGLLDLIAEPLRLAARADAVARGEAKHPSGVDGVTVTIVPARS